MTWRREYVFRVTPSGCARFFLILVGVIGLLAATAYVLRAPILARVGRQLVDVDPLAPSDAIVVLARAVPDLTAKSKQQNFSSTARRR